MKTWLVYPSPISLITHRPDRAAASAGAGTAVFFLYEEEKQTWGHWEAINISWKSNANRNNQTWHHQSCEHFLDMWVHWFKFFWVISWLCPMRHHEVNNSSVSSVFCSIAQVKTLSVWYINEAGMQQFTVLNCISCWRKMQSVLFWPRVWFCFHSSLSSVPHFVTASNHSPALIQASVFKW